MYVNDSDGKQHLTKYYATKRNPVQWIILLNQFIYMHCTNKLINYNKSELPTYKYKICYVLKIVARYWKSYIIIIIFFFTKAYVSGWHTFNGNSVDRPCDFGCRVATHPAGEHSGFFRGQDEVLRGTDPKRSRCGDGESSKSNWQNLKFKIWV